MLALTGPNSQPICQLCIRDENQWKIPQPFCVNHVATEGLFRGWHFATKRLVSNRQRVQHITSTVAMPTLWLIHYCLLTTVHHHSSTWTATINLLLDWQLAELNPHKETAHCGTWSLHKTNWLGIYQPALATTGGLRALINDQLLTILNHRWTTICNSCANNIALSIINHQQWLFYNRYKTVSIHDLTDHGITILL